MKQNCHGEAKSILSSSDTNLAQRL